MPYNGSGIFQRLYSWTQDAAGNIAILASRMDNETNGIAAGLTNCVTRDGQSPPTTNLPMGGYKFTNMAVGTATTDSVNYGQISGLATSVTANTTAITAETTRASAAEAVLSGQVATNVTNIALLQGTVTSGRRAYSTYASAVSDAATPVLYAAVTLGTVAEVPTTDAGTHTDPVVGGTVNNTGVFRWSTLPAGWQRISDTSAASAAPYATAASASATAAAASAAAAAASAAAAHTSVLLTGTAPPGANAGVAGDFFIDTTNLIEYGPRSSTSWGQGRPITLATASGFSIHDFRYGGLPTGLAITRAQSSTDAVYDDVPGRAYTTFSANLPVYRSDKGMALFPSSRNYLLNSTTPATQTVTLAVGKYVMWGNGTGSLATAAGTAVGTGFGTLTLTDRTYQSLNITSAGTVSVTLTGGCNYFQLENNPLSLTHATPTPLIVTAGAAVTRDGDLAPVTGTLLTFLNSGTGTLVFETMAVLPFAGASGTRFLGTNNNSGLYTTASQSTTYWNGVDSASSNTTGTSTYTTDQVKSAVAWSGTTVSFGSGTRIPKAQTTTFAHGDAITSAWIGASDSNTNVTNSMSGWLVRLHTNASRLSDTDLYDYYTALPRLTTSVNSNFVSTTSLPKWKAALALMRGNVRDVTLLAYGTSHTAGTNPSGTIYATNYPTTLAGLLTAAGIPASTNSICGNGGIAPAAGVSTYDSNMTFSAGCTLWGNPPQDSLRFAAGGTIDRVCAGTTDTATIFYEVGVGFGTIDVSVNGGASISTINTAGAAAIGKTIVTVPSGTNTFRLTATGQVVIIMAIFSNSSVRQVNVINGGHVGATAATLAGASGSYSAMGIVTALAPDLTVFEAVTNDASASTAQATYTAAIQTVITTCKLSGDIIMMTDPPTSTAVVSTALQNTYSALQTSVALQNNCPVIDIYGGMTGGFAAWDSSGFYFDTIHLKPPWGYGMMAARVNAMIAT